MSIFGTVQVGLGGARSAATAAASAVNTALTDLIVVAVGWSDSGTVTSVTDIAGNTYTPLTKRTGGGVGFLQYFYCLAASAASASNIITAHFSFATNNYTSIISWNVTLTGGTAAYDADSDIGTGSSGISGTITTTGSSDDILFGFVFNGSGATASGASGYTFDGNALSSGTSFAGGAHKLLTGTISGTQTMFNAVSTSYTIALAFKAGVAAPVDKTHTIDAYVPTDVSKAYTIDAYVKDPKNTFTNDAYVQGFSSRTYTIDGYTAIPTGQVVKIYNIDALVSGPGLGFLKLAGTVLFKILPNNYVILKGVAATPQRSYLKLTANVAGRSRLYINLAANVVTKTRSYVRLAANVIKGSSKTYGVDAVVGAPFCIPATPIPGVITVAPQTILPPPPPGVSSACQNQSYINLAASIRGTNNRKFIKLAAWVVAPGGSVQVPGNSNFTAADDFLSSQLALSSYSKNSIFILTGANLPAAGIALIVQAFTAGVQSFQTRTRTWLKRVDIAPNGILVTQTQNVHQLPNGETITTTTQVTKQKDVTITTIIIKDSGTPARVTKIVTEKSASGNSTTRETDTTTQNGIVYSTTKKTVYTQPPTTDNIQPLQVKTLDGIIHYQFFGPPPINTEWSGGDAEGVTSSATQTSIVPGTLNGSGVDPFGNPIYKKTSKVIEDDPTGKHIAFPNGVCNV